MKINDFLLSDEQEIEESDYIERQNLYNEFKTMPIEFFSKLRHFQPQIGCLNACKICSKFAGTKTEYWTEARQRNVIAALKYSTPQDDCTLPLIVWDRNEHRSGVIFSYLDNDIGNYYYLDSFIALAYRELKVTTRISTVGYSRHNERLNEMHKRINSPELLAGLGGVRLSFTPYEIGWECNNLKERFNRFDYTSDMANLLKIYKPYYEKVGSGSRNMCVEIRYKPLVNITNVYEVTILGHMVIATANYLYISKDVDVTLKESKIADPYDHTIKLTEEPVMFHQINLYSNLETLEEVKRVAHKFIIGNVILYPLVEVYLLSNADGYYYSIEPRMKENGNLGINIYPNTTNRKISGYLITERFLVNAIISYKARFNLKSLDKFENATWNDVYEVLNICNQIAATYMTLKIEKYTYIINEVLPMINAYISALQEANYPASTFFDPNFTIDTGIICNLGRAVSEFCGLTSKQNEPLTPVHERNYGKYNSKMSQEGTAWRLSCNYNNSIIIEKLELFNTTAENGQTAYKKLIQLDSSDEVLTTDSLNDKCLIPGQRRL